MSQDPRCRSRRVWWDAMGNPGDQDDEGDDFDDVEEVDESELLLPPQKRIFVPGTSPSAPPASTSAGELRFSEGVSYVTDRPGAPAKLILADLASAIQRVASRPEGQQRKASRWSREGLVFDKEQARLHEVHKILRDTTEWVDAKIFVRQHHYAHSLPNIQKAIWHGLYKKGVGLVGVAIYSMPGGKTVKLSGATRAEPVSILSVFPGGVDEALELSRFILLPSVPFGGETWFLSRSRELLLRQGLRGFTSFSDPHEWYKGGVVIKPGHFGQIYKAAGLAYLGKGKPGKVWFTDDFRAIPPQSISKIRTGKSGWLNQVRRLVDLGAKPPRSVDKAVRDRMRITGEDYNEAFERISRGKIKPTHSEEEMRPWVDRELLRIGAFEMIVPGKHKFAFLVDPTRDRELVRIKKTVEYAWSPRPWSAKPVALPHFPKGRPGAPDPRSLARFGHEPPEKSEAPERGRMANRQDRDLGFYPR